MERGGSRKIVYEGIAVPGEAIAVIEEFSLPRRNVPYAYEEGGVIYAAQPGRIVKDLERKVISIFTKFRNPAVQGLKLGEVVYGQVVAVSESIAIVKIHYGEGGGKLTHPVTGVLHISQVSHEFIRTMFDAVKCGDYIKAKVISTYGPPYMLSTKDPSLGVVLARCPKCGKPMLKRGPSLVVCLNCGIVARRKLSPAYMIIR